MAALELSHQPAGYRGVIRRLHDIVVTPPAFLLEWASSGRGPDSPLSSDLALDKPRPTPSPRQIHPLYGEKAGLLGYCDTVGNTENFPPAPNIVVEGGRIEFVRPSQDGTTTPRRNTMSRASQTFNEQQEKSDPAKV
ncbi:hypothetical protein P5V15_013618 [Pogonomyrmex californicus]